MKRETCSESVAQTSVSVMETRVESVRTKNILRNAVRLYDGKHLGIGGALGAADPAVLEAKARAALDHEIPYPFDPVVGEHRVGSVRANVEGGESFAEMMRDLLAQLRQRQPGFVFSGTLNHTTTEAALRNEMGADYSYRGSAVDLALWIKQKGSGNILDAGVGYQGIRYDPDTFIETADLVCDGFTRETDITDGEYPVVFLSTYSIHRIMLARSLHGLTFGSGTSIFSGKIGERLFSEKVSVRQSRREADDVYLPFFDAEGAVNEGDSFTLIEAGTLVSPYTTRTYAARFHLPHTGSAAGEYDAVPNLAIPELVLENTGQSITSILDGQPAVLVFIASGGDFTTDGAFATPVQLGFLYDGSTILGRLPGLNLSSHVYRMYGDDFIGVSTDPVLPVGGDRAVVMKMKVQKTV